MVVDDEEKILNLIEIYLAKEGFTVLTAMTGNEAMQKVGSHQRILQ
ncbi:MAG: hypothetical protein ACOX3A_07020 [bacterium]